MASVAALILSYAYETELDISTDQLRKILTRTAEDILCDPTLQDCDCSDVGDECAGLVGWDRYSGYGRVDAGRALTLPVAVLELDHPEETFVEPGETMTLEWEAFDINEDNGNLDESPAHFELHYLYPEELQGQISWHEIATDIDYNQRVYTWVVPESEDLPPGLDRRLRFTVVDSEGNTNYDIVRFKVLDTNPETSGADTNGNPTCTIVKHATPNPASISTRISYVLGTSSEVRIRIFDVTGKLVRRVLPGEQAAGPHAVDWDGNDESGTHVPSGVYFIRLDLGSDGETMQLVWLQ